MPKIIHFRAKCIGCGICQEQQPNLWAMSKKDGKAVLLNAEIKKHTHVLAITHRDLDKSAVVAAMCPVGIIKVNA